MTLRVTNPVSNLTKHFETLRTLRKVKFYIQPRAITVVTYYQAGTGNDEQVSYQGKAYIFTYTAWKGTSVALAHTSHLPPPEDTEETKQAEQEEIELEPAPSLPGFGFATL